MRPWVVTLVGSAALLAAGVTAAAAPCARTGGETVVVGYRSAPALSAAAAAADAVVVRRLPAIDVAELRLRDPARAGRLAHAQGIRFVRRPETHRAAAEPAVAFARSDASGGGEWQFDATHEGDVPDTVLRAAAAIRIAVVDTGADLTVPDLAAKSPAAYSVVTRTANVPDDFGHGTFVASLAAGSVTNGEGIAGFGGDAQLLVVKADEGDGTFTDVDEAAGILYAVAHGARILNLSLGSPETSPVERRAIRYAIRNGVLVVAAAGNSYSRGNPVVYPAALLQPVGSDGAGGAGLAVAASTPTGARASFSSTGSWISLAAPGLGVLGDLSSLAPSWLFPRAVLPGVTDGLFGYASGTSFAAPQVAGAAALVWAANPSLTAQQVAQILKQTASGHGRWTPDLGFGVIDVGAAVAWAQSGRTPVTPGAPSTPLTFGG
jgi:subtilisin family serine protease